MRDMNPRSQSSRSAACWAKAAKVESYGRREEFGGSSTEQVDVIVVGGQVASETVEIVGLVQMFCGGKLPLFAELAVCGSLA